MLELNQCYNMDCMKGMAQFPDGFFDLAVVDPPYFRGPERRGYYGSKVSKIGVYRDYPVSPVWEIPGRAYFDELRSRVERMFGARDTWKSADPDADQGPYRGFLIVQCEECGAIKAFCAKHETYGYKCGECGHETPLEKLRPLFMHCKCGKSFSYKTNLTAERVTHTCLACKAPVDLELNSRKTAYVTVGERR